MKYFFKTILLLRDLLNENNIPLEKLIQVLDKYILMVNEFLKIENIDKEEIEYLIIKDTLNSIEAFKNIMHISLLYLKGKE